MADDPSSSLARGMSTREKVMGKAYVQKVMHGGWEFEADFQTIITQHVWGTIWARPGLTYKERSLLNLGMVAALNRPHQLAAHLRGALNNGVSPDEIREVFIQVSAYCGAPAGIECFKVARQVFEEDGIDV